MDNASVNDVLARTLGFLLLKRYGIHFDPQNGQIHCIAHVVNLVVQKMLNKLEEAVDPNVDDYYERNKHVPFHYDPETDEDQKALDEEEDEEEDESSEDEEASGLSPNGGPIGDEDDEDDELVQQWSSHSAVKKLRLICTKIASSPQRRSSFRKIVHSAYASSHPDDVRRRRLMVIRDVVTRWNYTHAMIERALFMRTAIDTWVFNNVKLRELLLSQQEWALLKSIAGLLEIFTKVTKAMSRAHTPTLPYVLPMYEHMRKSLIRSTEDPVLSKTLRDAAAAGLEKLLQYYHHAKVSDHTMIATILHPSLRLRWFEQNDMIAVATARKTFEDAYKDYQRDVPQPEAPPPAATQVEDHSTDFMDEICGLREPTPDAAKSAESDDELTRYLSMAGGKVAKDDSVLMWWK
ncbi:hypothetical protein EIP86_005777, partial [Pleurotus ostreatoroseus]